MRGVALILKKVQVIKLDKKDLKFKGLCVLGKEKNLNYNYNKSHLLLLLDDLFFNLFSNEEGRRRSDCIIYNFDNSEM